MQTMLVPRFVSTAPVNHHAVAKCIKFSRRGPIIDKHPRGHPLFPLSVKTYQLFKMRFTAILPSILCSSLAATEVMTFRSNGELVQASTVDTPAVLLERGHEELVAANGTHLEKRIGFQFCRGSSSCGSCCDNVNMGALCNWAFLQIDEDETYFTGTDRYSTGVCQTAQEGHGCGIFIKKENKKRKNICAIKGRGLKAYFNEIRHQGCRRCGRLPQLNEDGCEIHVDYVTGCRVRWLQPYMVSQLPGITHIPSRAGKPPKVKKTGVPATSEALVMDGVTEPAGPTVTGHV
ncbi:MAG: hypothetical protein LQ351_007875 [Letrouitia transgressa]|nr:MAG: hypothetical protein LQ351_007875 [Letrouitia transgressa]